MITEKVFLDAIDKLNSIFPENALSPEAAKIYYETMSPDFTDEQFTKQVNVALKNSFKFPPIAAFYKGMNDLPEVFEPVNPQESAAIRRTLEKYDY